MQTQKKAPRLDARVARRYLAMPTKNSQRILPLPSAHRALAKLQILWHSYVTPPQRRSPQVLTHKPVVPFGADLLFILHDGNPSGCSLLTILEPRKGFTRHAGTVGADVVQVLRRRQLLQARFGDLRVTNVDRMQFRQPGQVSHPLVGDLRSVQLHRPQPGHLAQVL